MDMEKTRALLLRICERLNHEPLPGIYYAGPVGQSIHNSPHPALQFCFMTEGVFRGMRVGTLRHDLHAGDVALMNLHFGVTTAITPGVYNWNVYLDVDDDTFFTDLADAPCLHVWRVTSRERMLAAFRTVAARKQATAPPTHWRYMSRGPGAPMGLSLSGGPAASVFLKAALFELLAIMLDDVQDVGSPRLPAAVQTAIDFIATHYADPELDFQAVADAGGLSPSQLRRLFQRELHIAPMHLLRRMRLMQGRVLLEQTSLPISDVAAGVGFTDPLYFSRAFHAETGYSPQVYRRRLESEGQR